MNAKNIFTELKRRNVYRAAVAYGVLAWFLTQLTTQVLPLFEIPNSAMRFVVIALAVDFPIAIAAGEHSSLLTQIATTGNVSLYARLKS